MTYPILYSPTETTFANNGLGALSDCISCFVTEERNGAFEMVMEYPVNGIHYKDIVQRSIIRVKPNPTDPAQPFRVYRITRPIHGVITVYCAHISYDLSGVPVSPFTAYNLASAISQMQSNSISQNDFTMTTDKATVATMTVVKPMSYRSLMGGVEGSILDVFGGEYHYNGFEIQLLNSRGSVTGVSLRYGKNITSLEQDENCASCYTGVFPYWYSEDDGLVQGSIVPCSGTYDYINILSLDCTDQFGEMPTSADLDSYAQTYIEANDVGIPSVSLSVGYAQDSVLCESVALCDTITVEFPAIGVFAYAKVNRTVYNALTGVFDSVELGNMRTSIAQTIADQSAQIQNNSNQLYIETRKLIHDWSVTEEEFRSSIAELNSNFTSQIEQLNNQITISVSSMNASLSNVITDVSALWEFASTSHVEDNGQTVNLSKYIRFEDGSIVLGVSDSDMKLRIENDQIVFFTGEDFDANATIYAKFTPSELLDAVVKALSSVYVGNDSDSANFKQSKTVYNNVGEFTLARV